MLQAKLELELDMPHQRSLVAASCNAVDAGLASHGDVTVAKAANSARQALENEALATYGVPSYDS